ncbi:MAG: methylmalonyl-CoA epimerase [Actinomycetota bacterium]|nr:methylmalonyl-CoA epimerase [Actinomycetota bacterium]MDP2288308.1 methylmalonyl-CoA epimerase [Actinomycetota bacterium]
MSAMDPIFKRVDHVGIAVADLDVAMKFYSEVFGMTVLHEEVNEEQGVREAMVGIDGSGAQLQLLAPTGPESTIAKFLDRNGPGIQQMAYTVENVDAASDELRARGIRMLYDTPKRGTGGSRINFAHPKDCGGVLVELVEPPANAAH